MKGRFIAAAAVISLGAAALAGCGTSQPAKEDVIINVQGSGDDSAQWSVNGYPYSNDSLDDSSWTNVYRASVPAGAPASITLQYGSSTSAVLLKCSIFVDSADDNNISHFVRASTQSVTVPAPPPAPSDPYAALPLPDPYAATTTTVPPPPSPTVSCSTGTGS